MAARTLEVVAEPESPTIVITRDFDAPRRLVFEAWTRPEHVKHWWGLRDHTLTICEIDLRVGGRYRYAMVTPKGFEVAFHGEYLEVVPNERLVTTETYEGVPEGVSEADATTVNTATLVERDGRTTLTLLIEAPNQVSRDAIVDSGMEDGLQDALDLLEQVALSLA